MNWLTGTNLSERTLEYQERSGTHYVFDMDTYFIGLDKHILENEALHYLNDQLWTRINRMMDVDITEFILGGKHELA